MDTIMNYLDNMFKHLPKTNQIMKLKEEILSNMEDKYHELKNSGKTENEAIGIVISEFGNIDELMEEFDIKQQSDDEFLRPMEKEEVDEFLRMNKRFSKMIGLGVILCILAPALLILINQFIDGGIIAVTSQRFADIAGLIPFFLFIAIAVVIFIYAGMGMEKYKYIDYGVEIQPDIQGMIRQNNEEYQSTFVMSIIIGVILIILSPITLIIISTFTADSSIYGVVVLLSMVAAAVYIFIYSGIKKDGYQKLLKIGDYSKQHKEQDKVIAAVSVIIWPLAVCIFLITGFVFQAWAINWLIFPVVALLFSMFSGAYKILKTDGR
ncbi:permease prefix domain 1-containing protein [Radiobacillus sp. PE A8.2]|uniref:permease prefix domain 1-containing protein n=1 Tax=Radiobacillus sp. PE A8.2 TaxID=3380349 RepID=UPI00388E3009